MAALAEPNAHQVGDFLGPFELVESLPSDSGIERFLAREHRHGKPVRRVLLECGPEALRDSPAAEAFLEGARLAQGIKHPALRRVLDYGTVEGRVYIAHEWLVGTTFRDLAVKAATLPEVFDNEAWVGVACHLVAEAAAAVHAVHETGPQKSPLGTLAPRDCIVTGDGHVRLCGSERLVPGTPKSELTDAVRPYAAPERFGTNYDVRADVWSLAAFLWELLHGVEPFGEPGSDPSRRLPSTVDAALLDALQADRGLRTATCDVFALQLRVYLSQSHPGLTTEEVVETVARVNGAFDASGLRVPPAESGFPAAPGVHDRADRSDSEEGATRSERRVTGRHALPVSAEDSDAEASSTPRRGPPPVPPPTPPTIDPNGAPTAQRRAVPTKLPTKRGLPSFKAPGTPSIFDQVSQIGSSLELGRTFSTESFQADPVADPMPEESGPDLPVGDADLEEVPTLSKVGSTRPPGTPLAASAPPRPDRRGRARRVPVALLFAAGLTVGLIGTAAAAWFVRPQLFSGLLGRTTADESTESHRVTERADRPEEPRDTAARGETPESGEASVVAGAQATGEEANGEQAAGEQVVEAETALAGAAAAEATLAEAATSESEAAESLAADQGATDGRGATDSEEPTVAEASVAGTSVAEEDVSADVAAASAREERRAAAEERRAAVRTRRAMRRALAIVRRSARESRRAVRRVERIAAREAATRRAREQEAAAALAAAAQREAEQVEEEPSTEAGAAAATSEAATGTGEAAAQTDRSRDVAIADTPAAGEEPRRSRRVGEVTIVTPGRWADVFLDRRYLGTSPLTVDVRPGLHSIRIRPSGYDGERTVIVNVSPGGEHEVRVPLITHPSPSASAEPASAGPATDRSAPSAPASE